MEIKLINSVGDERDLAQENLSLSSLDGLGFSRAPVFTRVGNDFFETEDVPVQKKPTGVLRISGADVYDDFRAFISLKPLKLAYKPRDAWNYLDCKVTVLKKAETLKSVYYCNIDFTAYGMWYRDFVAERSISVTGGKYYNYQYPYTYISSASGTCALHNDEAEPAPCRIHVFGPCTNPSWALEKNGVVTLTGKVTADIKAGEQLVIDSNPRSMEIARRLEDNTFVQTEYQSSDFSTKRFIFAPSGSSTLSITHEGSELIKVRVEVRQIADTV